MVEEGDAQQRSLVLDGGSLAAIRRSPAQAPWVPNQGTQASTSSHRTLSIVSLFLGGSMTATHGSRKAMRTPLVWRHRCLDG